MEVFRAGTSSTNGLAEEERNSSTSIHYIVHKEGNMAIQTEPFEHDFLTQHDDGFPIITSVFSLASSSSEIKSENHDLTMEVIDNPLTFAPGIPKTIIPDTIDYSEEGNYSPVVSSFVVKCNQDDAIPPTVSSQIRTTGVKHQDINHGFQSFLTGCYTIASSDTELTNLLRVNGTNKDIDYKVEDDATNFDSVLSWKRSHQCPTKRNNLTVDHLDWIATCNTADATNVGITTEREDRIHRLKDLVRQKKAEVEKVRFLSKQSTLSATIDKIKVRLSTINDSLGRQTSSAYPNKESEHELLPNAPNLDKKNMCGCDDLLNLVLDGNTVESTKYQNNANESSNSLKMLGASACLEERRLSKVNEKLWLGTTTPYLYGQDVHENIVKKNENQGKEEVNIPTTTTEDRRQSINPKKRRSRPKKRSSKSSITANKRKSLADRNKKASSHCPVSSAITSTTLHPTYMAHSYYNEASSGNCSKSSIPSPLNCPVHHGLIAKDISHANPASSNLLYIWKTV